MRYIQYVGPSDTFDVSPLLGKPTVFHTPTNITVPLDQRGNIVQVTNEHFDELMTYPNHAFREVGDTIAKEIMARQDTGRKNREGLAALQSAQDQNVATFTLAAQLAAIPVAPEVAPSAARPASEIKAETRAESAALKTQTAPTEEK